MKPDLLLEITSHNIVNSNTHILLGEPDIRLELNIIFYYFFISI